MHASRNPPAPAAHGHWEWQYLALMRHIWEDGDERIDRTGVGTRAIFGPQLRFDLADGRVPLLTTKRVFWKAAAREMLWFLTGSTSIRPLLQQGVTIWSDWPLARYRRETGEDIAQEAFERRVVEDEAFAQEWGDLGPVYGKQWVDWPTYEAVDLPAAAAAAVAIHDIDPEAQPAVHPAGSAGAQPRTLQPGAPPSSPAGDEPAGSATVQHPGRSRAGAELPAGGERLYRRGPGINQVARLVEGLRRDPGGRRHIVEGWNVAELERMALPPCHKTYQFHVATGRDGRARLSCQLYQRSCDVALGLPFNLFGAALLTRMVAAQAGYAPGELVWTGGDTHLYLNHADLVAEQLSREPAGEPRLHLKRVPESIFDYRFEDFAVSDYHPQPAIRAPVAV